MAQYRFERLRGEYRRRWDAMRVTRPKEARQQAELIARHRETYKEIERTTGVPWEAVGVLHLREAGPQDVGRWQCCLHNGQRIIGTGRVTTIVPKGRGPFGTFKEAAVDALTGEGLANRKEWNEDPVAFLAYLSEKFNGFGYRSPSRNIPSPYLWGGTSEQRPGKFVSDGKYDPNVVDSQIGTMAVLYELIKLSPSERWTKRPVIAPKPPPPPPEDRNRPSPKAEEPEGEATNRLPKSKTIWGGIMSFLTTVVTAVVGFFDKLGENPYAWGFFTIVLIAGAIFTYMVIKGRIDVAKLVDHLSDDEVRE